MRVLKSDLRVRRLDDGQSNWIWYCMLRHMWKSYGHKVPPSVLHWVKKNNPTFLCVDPHWFPCKQDAKGNSTPQSAAIEEHFQRNPRSSFSFSIGSQKYKILFRGKVDVKKNIASYSSRLVLALGFLGWKQVGPMKNRAVRRRPVFRPKQQGAG